MTAVQEADKQQKTAVAEGMCMLLADTYALYLKTQNFHWNVKGPMFQTLHRLFEEQYVELAAAADLIAERIRALGVRAPASFSEFANLTSIKESTATPPATDMVRQLLADNESLAKSSSRAFQAAEESGDQATMDLLTDRIQVHDKASWMLRSHLEE